MKIFRDRLKHVVTMTCADQGLTQEELAEKLGYGRTRFRNYFTRATHIPVDVLCDIADQLGVDTNWLLGREGATMEWPKLDPVSRIEAKIDRLTKP